MADYERHFRRAFSFRLYCGYALLAFSWPLLRRCCHFFQAIAILPFSPLPFSLILSFRILLPFILITLIRQPFSFAFHIITLMLRFSPAAIIDAIDIITRHCH
jgi:hypothetical protein